MTIELCEGGLFRLYQGDTKILHFQVRDGEGEPVTVTGATAAIFSLLNTEKAEVLRRTLADTVTLSGSIITVVIPHSMTGDLLGQYLFALKITDSSGYKHTVSQGTAEVLEALIHD